MGLYSFSDDTVLGVSQEQDVSISSESSQGFSREVPRITSQNYLSLLSVVGSFHKYVRPSGGLMRVF